MKSLAVVPLDLRQLKSLEVDALHLDGMHVAIGALPPGFILDAAMRALHEGKPSVWFSPYAFMDHGSNQVVKGFPVDGRVEIGYGIAEEFRGKGFATRAVRELLQAATDNLSSRRVIEKAGFRRLGRRATDADGIVNQGLVSK